MMDALAEADKQRAPSPAQSPAGSAASALGVYYDDAYLRAAAPLEPEGTLHVFRYGKAIIPLVVRSLPAHCGGGVDAISPYDFSGPLLRGEDPGRVWTALCAWANERGIVTAFLRFHPFLADAQAWQGLPGFEVFHSADNVIVELDSPDVMLARCRKRKRRDLKIARREGVVCGYGPISEAALDIFVPMYHRSMSRLDAAPFYWFPRCYFDVLCRDMGFSFAIATAHLNGQVIAAALLLLDGPIAYYYLACSDLRSCAMNMVLFESACRLAEAGCETLHLGAGPVGVRQFKERFGPGRVPYYIGRAVFDRKRYTDLCSGKPSAYFPAYRAPYPPSSETVEQAEVPRSV